MQFITWQSGNSNSEMLENFETIRQWWRNLNGKEIHLRQRILPENGDVRELDWEPQRFDETFAIANPDVRGITLYWTKPGMSDERSTTVRQLELDPKRQQLYIYPQSQPTLVMQIGVAALKYQTLTLREAEIFVEDNQTLILRDTTRLIEVKLKLDSQMISSLKEQLPE
ncbi:hypothetical protein [Oscillatoria acuminata]|uniref:Uncharacterized protein n=1 Tax=Oscillatoria acuminata PCC 6304 TaxID=56110 RepID=K9TL05_9CYAN|nr:hypothetical protein [Oscillatoria acuminata]AFY82801.1 hypothetical protein Oscil6304_3223 [Oscillatoria acuminata PCC 6304]